MKDNNVRARATNSRSVHCRRSMVKIHVNRSQARATPVLFLFCSHIVCCLGALSSFVSCCKSTVDADHQERCILLPLLSKSRFSFLSWKFSDQSLSLIEPNELEPGIYILILRQNVVVWWWWQWW